MPKYRITTNQTISRDYIVIADTEQHAIDTWHNVSAPGDAEQDFHDNEQIMNIDIECTNEEK